MAASPVSREMFLNQLDIGMENVIELALYYREGEFRDLLMTSGWNLVPCLSCYFYWAGSRQEPG